MPGEGKEHNEVHELENWRIRIRKEEFSSAKWEDWWGWMIKNKVPATDIEGARQDFIAGGSMFATRAGLEPPPFARSAPPAPHARALATATERALPHGVWPPPVRCARPRIFSPPAPARPVQRRRSERVWTLVLRHRA